MHHSFLLACLLIGQPPMEVQVIPLKLADQPRTDYLSQLPPEQRTAAEKIEALGGSVAMNHLTGKPPAELIIFRGDQFTDSQLLLLLPFKNSDLYGISFVGAKTTD